MTEPSGLPTFGAVEAAGPIDPGSMYDVTAVISNVTEAQLQEASTDYPAEVTGLYLNTDGVTDRTRQLAADLTAGTTNPYDAAKAIATYLRSTGPFTYDTTRHPAQRSEPGPGRLLPVRPAGPARVLRVLRLVHGPPGPQRGHPGPPGRGLRPGRVRRVRRVPGHPEAGPRLGRAVLPRATAGRSSRPPRRSTPSSSGPAAARRACRPHRAAPAWTTWAPSSRAWMAERSSRPRRASSRSPAGSRPGKSRRPMKRAPTTAGSSWRSWGWRSDMAHIAGSRRGAASGSSHPGICGWARMRLAAERAGIGRQPAETFYEYAGWLESELPSRAAGDSDHRGRQGVVRLFRTLHG